MTGNDLRRHQLRRHTAKKVNAPGDTLEEQIGFVFAGIHYKVLLAENEEAKRALLAKDGVSTDGSGTHRDAPTEAQPKTSGGDAQARADAGMKWNPKTKHYEKKLPNGKIFWEDPKATEHNRKRGVREA